MVSENLVGAVGIELLNQILSPADCTGLIPAHPPFSGLFLWVATKLRPKTGIERITGVTFFVMIRQVCRRELGRCAPSER